MESERKRRRGVVEAPKFEELCSSKRSKTESNSGRVKLYKEWSPEDVQEYFIQKSMTTVASVLKGIELV